jgi:uncharacterized membrane protein YphA (DoxX/SURF4 family)
VRREARGLRAAIEQRGRLLFIAAALIALLPVAAEAHEKWFFDSRTYPLRWDLFVSDGPAIAALAVLALFIALAIVWRVRGRTDFLPLPERLGATPQARRVIYALLPLVIGLHVAIPLLYGGTHATLLSPNVELHGAPAYLCGIIEIWIALSFLYGGLTRAAAVGLALLWAVGIAIAGFQSMLDNVLWLGIATFFFMAGRGPIAVDRFMFPAFEPSDALARHAVAALRIGLGASFLIVAFTEKLANVPYALAFLQRYQLNFTGFFGVPLSDHTFVLVTGGIELLVGLCLIFGVFVREIIIVTWLPINLTLTYFGAPELIGHLPIYGIMALLLIWIPGPENANQWISGLHLFHSARERAKKAA